MSNLDNLKEECHVGAQKRATVAIGERIGKLLNRLRTCNDEARGGLSYLAGCEIPSAGGSTSPVAPPPNGFIEELRDALALIEDEVTELESTLHRLNTL